MQAIIEQYQPLIYLLKCALHRIQPDWERFSAEDFSRIKHQSEFHGVAAMIGLVIYEAGNNAKTLSAEQKSYWKDTYFRSVRRSLLLDHEIAHVSKALSEAHIEHTRLKGCVTAHCYPKTGMREMCDVDLLIDDNMTAQAKDVMVTLGYRVDEYGMSHHDVYSKEPFFFFELHNKLFMDVYTDYHSYFLGCREKMIPVSSDGYERQFTDDDFYLFQIAHACKHLHKYGIGLRALTDIYVINRSMDLHREYIDGELKKLGVDEDEQHLSALSEKLFSHPECKEIPLLSKKEEALLSVMLHSGAKGTFEQMIKNQSPDGLYADTHDMRMNCKRYIKRRIFPQPETYKTTHPFFYRHKFARPVLPLVRFTTSLVKRKGKVKKELKRIRCLSEKEET